VTHTSLVVAGRYRLDGLIAAGGVGEVWRAMDLILSRPVAVKLLHPEYAHHPETLARFEAEARHAASLTHPGIAQVYDYGEEGAGAARGWARSAGAGLAERGGGRSGAGAADSPYLVMELVDGPSLAGVLAAGPLDPATTMDVLAQAADGLQAAHAAGLVHRDIKPANLLVGPGDQVKITDFGIAYAAGSAPVTRTGLLVGTPAYLAPERAEGGPATPACDLYSLGVVGYECLTGSAPFRGMPIEVAAAHRLVPLPALPPTVPAGVAGLIAELTAKDPAARPASAGEVAERAGRLRDYLTAGATAVLASEPGGPPEAAREAWQPATLVGAPAASAAPARPAHRRRPGRAVALAVAVVVAGLTAWLVVGTIVTTPSAAPHAAGRTPATQAARTVEVNAGALTGQPVGAVGRQLRQLGLHPHVVWAINGAQAPGTVVSVQPSGAVPIGSAVRVIAALAPPGQRHDHGHDHGQGGDQGGGGQGDGGG
jgi:serine/threonine-protein kinase